jgi:RimJ/RimL family protein N-acetyltransferase
MSELIETESLRLKWSRAPWDEAVCPFPVIQIDHIEVRGELALEDTRAFEQARARIGAGLVSCRLSHDKLAESMLLEACGFRFIEMLYAPELDLATVDPAECDELTIEPATQEEMPAILGIAGSAFQNERFKVDPRLDPTISDRRYQNWVASTPSHPTQRLYAISDHGRLIAFFIVELQVDGTCYWHLNAVAPGAQGQGYGRRIWSAMVRYAKRSNARRVRTSVVARNTRVLSLYARLGFTLPAPAMTFHWVKE